MTTLYIDTTSSAQTIIAVVKDGQRKEYTEATGDHKSQNVLPMIEKALKKEQLTLQDLTHIEVNIGPGSFTGTRVGIAVANTLGWTLGIPVNGKKGVVPEYEASKFD